MMPKMSALIDADPVLDPVIMRVRALAVASLLGLMVLGGVALAVGGWFLAHRYGRMRGLVDANKNGVDDRVENLEKAGGA